MILSATAVHPLFTSQPLRSADWLIHLYRYAELAHLLGQGNLFSRWAPDLLGGYGLPLFNFFPPFSYYLPAALQWLGASLVASFNLAMAATIVLSGVTMYRFMRDLLDERAAVVSAVAYMYAPYMLFQSFQRGNLGETLGLALFPLVLWASYRLASSQDLRYLLATAMVYGALILAHHATAAVLSPLLLLFWGGLLASGNWSRRAFYLNVAALLLGLAMSAFFWIPAVADSRWIQIERISLAVELLPISRLLTGAPPRDLGLMNRSTVGIGLVQTLLVIVAMVGLRQLQDRRSRWHFGLTLSGVGIFALFLLPVSRPLWEQLPLVTILQWTYRLMAPLTFLVGSLAGTAFYIMVRRLEGQRRAQALFLSILLLLMISSAPLLYPHRQEGIPTDPTLDELGSLEKRYGTLGATSFGEILPIWVQSLPDASREGAPLERATLRRGIRVVEEDLRPTERRIVLYAPQPSTATFNILYFPGWRVYVDGNPVTAQPAPSTGLIQASVPAGWHDLVVRFEETPIRLAADLVSVGGLVVLLALVGVTFRSREGGVAKAGSLPARTQFSWASLALLGTLFFAIKVAYLDNHDTPLKYGFDGKRVRSAQESVEIDFAEDLSLLGYDLARDSASAGDTLGVTLYWRARRELDTDYHSFVHLIDREFNIYAQEDHVHPGPNYPTSRWDLDEYNRDAFQISLPETLPAGEYLVEAGLYGGEDGQNLPVVSDGEFTIWQPSAILQSISVGDVSHTLPDEAQPLTDARFGDFISLLGYELSATVLHPGDTLRLTLQWRANRPPGQVYSSFVHLVDDVGTIYAQHDNLFLGVLYPATRWRQGEHLLEVHEISVPPDTPPGDYTLGVGIYDPGTLERLPMVSGQDASGFLALRTISVGPLEKSG